MKIKGTMTGLEFDEWLKTMGLSWTKAGEALGLSRATIANLIRCGKEPIPLLVQHACNWLKHSWRAQR